MITIEYTYPIRKNFYIEGHPEDWWTIDVPIPSMEETIAFLGLEPKKSDLPDWLIEPVKESELMTLYHQQDIRDNFTIVPDLLTCSGKFLSHAELRLWIILRKRVPDKDRDGYHRAPVIEISLKQIGSWMGITKRYAKKLVKKLEKKNVIRVDRERGRPLRILLFDLHRVLEAQEDKLKGIERGRLRSIIGPQSTILKAISYVKSRI